MRHTQEIDQLQSQIQGLTPQRKGKGGDPPQRAVPKGSGSPQRTPPVPRSSSRSQRSAVSPQQIRTIRHQWVYSANDETQILLGLVVGCDTTGIQVLAMIRFANAEYVEYNNLRAQIHDEGVHNNQVWVAGPRTIAAMLANKSLQLEEPCDEPLNEIE